MGNPAVSIIVPVYNVKPYLETCLGSLIEQTCEDIEIICIDDGSTDGSSEVIDEFAARDTRLVVVHQENAGVAHARNVGLDVARGSHILFVDADDLIRFDTCEILLAQVERTGAEIIVFGGRSFPPSAWADGSFAQRNKVYRKNSIDALLIEPGANPLMCNKFYSASFLEMYQLRFNEALVLGEDNAFQFAAFPFASTVSFINDALYFYRMRSDSAVLSRMDDHEKKLYLHFDLATYIINMWETRSLVTGHERELYSWAIDLIYTEASRSSFDVRERFAHQYEAYFGERVSAVDVASLGSDVLEHHTFLLSAQCAREIGPRCTIVIDATGSGNSVVDTFTSAAMQTEQAIEIVIWRSPEMDLETCREIEKCASMDGRVRVLDSADAFDVIRKARGAYLLWIACNEELDGAAVGRVLREIESVADMDPFSSEGGPRVVSFDDAGKRLRCKNPLDVCVPDPRGDPSRNGVVKPADMEEHTFDIPSLALGNKCIERVFLVELHDRACSSGFFRQDEAISLYGLYAYALIEADDILYIDEPLITLRSLQYHKPAEAAEAACDLIAWFDGGVVKWEVPAALARSLRYAVATLALMHLELIRDRGDFEAAHVVVRESLLHSGIVDLPIDLSYITASDSKRISVLMEEESDRCFDRLNAMLVDELIEVNGKLLGEALRSAHNAERFFAEAREFYESISYRVGRAVTLMPRKATELFERFSRKR